MGEKVQLSMSHPSDPDGPESTLLLEIWSVGECTRRQLARDAGEDPDAPLDDDPFTERRMP